MASSIDKENNQVLFEESKGVRKVVLNRPRQLNCLNYEMISQMLKMLRIYETDPLIKLVILKGNGRAFCSGGDVKAVINSVTQGHWSFGASFFSKQLTLDYIVGTYKKPVVSILDGIVMGGGAGLSMHTPFRIVTENTIFSMPEAGFGAFPDCGASHFLSRLPGYFGKLLIIFLKSQNPLLIMFLLDNMFKRLILAYFLRLKLYENIGEYIGLTGAHLDGTEMLACGLATHFVLSKDLGLMEDALAQLIESGLGDMPSIFKTINKFVHKIPLKKDSPYGRLEVINKSFSADTVEEILSCLEKLAAQNEEKWIINSIKSMTAFSPTSLKLFLRLIREGRTQGLEKCLVSEFRVFCHTVRRTIGNDLFEGSRALLFEKDKKPQWMPSKLELVSREMVEKSFSEVEDDDDWKPLELPARYSHGGSVPSKL